LRCDYVENRLRNDTLLASFYCDTGIGISKESQNICSNRFRGGYTRNLAEWTGLALAREWTLWVFSSVSTGKEKGAYLGLRPYRV